jgi:hypothetical protein
MAAALASQCVDATIPKVPISSGRVVNRMVSLELRGLRFDWLDTNTALVSDRHPIVRLCIDMAFCSSKQISTPMQSLGTMLELIPINNWFTQI